MRKILKPWGYEQILEKNKKYVVKKLFMKKNHRCSLQYHKVKLETVYVLSGILKFQIGSKINNLKTKILRPGDCVSINKKKIHRMHALKNTYYLEASTPDLDDVIRIKDDFNRI